MDTISIGNEEDALNLLKQLIDGYEIEHIENIELKSWPKFVIHIQGEDFKGTIPTRIMPALLNLQKEVHKVYCISNYGDDNLRHLTKDDREKLELVVKVNDGSSIFETLLQDPILKTLQDAVGKMTPSEITLVLIVFGVCATSVVFWRSWLAQKGKEKELEQTIELSQLEKEKMEIVQRAAKHNPACDLIMQGLGDLRSDILTKLRPQDKLEVSADTADENLPSFMITGDTANELVSKPREKAVERKIEGEYFLRAADFSKIDHVRLDVEDIKTGYQFHADVPLGVLGADQEEALKDHSWERHPIQLAMLVKERHGYYSSAKVISVALKS
ncbi:hypothetical protein [Celerinatantimonas sp. YJH-8]|uniref:hypothetical protein n=1 Tax=Celerinatantimonas sp. YJH-8 TaxID=3228714 RepID=UPI0038C0001D